MEDNFMLVIIPYFAEVLTAEVPESVRDLRLHAIGEVRLYLLHYQQHGYMPKLLCAIAEKKCKRILTIHTKAEMERLLKPKCPYYDGNRFQPDEYSVPEEELICWSEASLRAPLNEAGFNRYMELFRQVLPEESKLLPI